MRQQVCKNKSWKKRVAAAGMAICMACTMPFSVQAENVTEEYNVQEDYSTESAAENISDEKSEVQSYDIETAQTVSQEDSAAQEPSKEEVQLSLQLVAVENTDTTTPILKLDAADQLSGKINVKDNKIEVTDGEGLILLSNVKPEDYADYAIELITTTGWDLTKPVKVGGKTSTDGTTDISGTEYSFLGLGSDDNPYAGTFRLDQGTAATQYSIATSRSLFNALSTKATFKSTIPFSIAEKESSTKEPLLAKTLKAKSGDSTQENSALICNIVLRDLNSDKISNPVIGGLIGTMEEGTSADITFTNQFTGDLKISGTDHVGLFCNTMQAGSSLTATFTSDQGAGKISVEATESDKDAGGFVGHMEADASLTVAGTSVSSVASSSGNAGGIVGSSVDGNVTVKVSEQGTNNFQFADSITLSSGSDKAAGGLIGSYSIAKAEKNFDLSSYQFTKSTITGGKNAGGLFGELKITNTADTAGISVSISGNTENFDNNTKTITTEVSNANVVTNYGGLIGSYQSSNMKNTLTIEKTAIATTGGEKLNNESSYGGVIGEISDNSYVEIENVNASTSDMKSNGKASFGGLVGKMKDGLLNVGDVTLISSSDLSSDADNVDGRGGLVGHLVKGVLRLHGTTDLSGQKITTAYHHVGQIVGNNDDGLVYALGNGNGLNEDGSGWSLTRYTGADRGGSDIGNWGAVVRLGDKLSEGDNGVFAFDKDAHTVQVHNGTRSELGSANAFAAYVLAFDLSKAYKEGSSAALSFVTTVDAAESQTVTLTGDIDLTGTGILGIGKDNIENEATAQKFAGTLDGSSHTITLDIGTTYGANVSGTEDNAAGQLYAKRSDQRDAHYSLALIPFTTGDVTIRNLTIVGTVACRVPQNVNEEENSGDIRYPAFVSATIGLAGGTTAFKNVTVNTKVSVAEEADTKKLHVWQAGFLGRCEGKALTFQNCTWGSKASLTDERSTDHQRIGGLAAEVMGGCTVTVEDCTLSGSITSKAEANARVGGLIAVSRGEDQNSKALQTTINISKLNVNGANITASVANKTSGGLLGYLWQNTNVVFAPANNTENINTGNTGVKISGSTLDASNAQFGGLVYQATGYWNATAANSIIFEKEKSTTTFTGKSTKSTPSGLLVGTGLIKVTQSENVESALYLEVGTWGDASDAAYKIGNDAVTLNINSDYFDELVGTTKKDDAGNSNAVVSLAVRDEKGTAERIDTDGTGNTHTGQLRNYKNGNTRYYYNLDSYRKNNQTLNLDSVTSPEDMVLWSAAQYAAVNIRGYFRQGDRTDVTITGSIDLTGYSYYPVTPLGAVNLGTNQTTTSLKFDYDGMNAKETGNKPLSDSDHQHYLMQHGLFYHTTHNIAVKSTSFSGTVGKESTAEAGSYSSGALIYGSVIGDPVSNIVEISLNNVTLAGICVTDIAKDSTAYAPLLINQMNQAVKLTVNALSTGEGYTTGKGSGKTTVYAASSLIGKVGSATATKLTLSFSNIALDGRLKEDTSKSTSVYNNGNVTVDYHTTHTIFTRATLLESFMYSSEGTGTYNFNSTDDKVTYGVELTNTGTTGRNPDKQYQYYDVDSYITDEQGKNANEAYVKSRYGSSNFIRYVYTQQNITESKYELDINQKTTGLLKGCGTYGDPYIIEDAHQLSSLAAYILNPGSVSKFQAIFNSKVLENQTQTAEGYHLQNGANSDATGTDITYTWENGAWKSENGNAADKETATNYLLNAYYKIDKDITLSAERFGGLGTKENPFSGVIVGASQNITVALTGTNENKDSFGGLIAYSRGSVVKDLIVDYSQATITMQAYNLPGSDKNPFFGGVVGYCMGGDTIIDHVSVNYAANSVTFSGTYPQMIAAGGYVGLVGGATHVTENTDYEKTGGGVVFRNMDGTSNTFTTACAAAAAANKTVNMVKADGTADGKSASNGGKYFYRNPYVGRVLDGYACAEGCTIDNTDKNYTIPTLTAGTNDLQVSEASGSLNVTVISAQGLWLLSAIVNSGAGAMDSGGSYTDVDKVVDAYQYGKPRTASYEGIGTVTGAANLTDEAYWGGVASAAGSDTAKNRVSYLVKNYTIGTTAARLAGKSTSADTNIPVMLTFATDSINMSDYGNGFRGIGSSYGNNKNVWHSDCSIPEVYRRNLVIKSINADRNADTVITLNMNQNDYHTEYSNGVWKNQGAGLFVDFHFTDGCKVNHLKISGNIKLGLFDEKGTLTYVKKGDKDMHIGVGGFAARTANSAGTVSFDGLHLEDINVYGGTMTGGAIGYIDGYSEKRRNVSFINNWTIQNENVTKWVNYDGSTGGLVGWNVGHGQLTITGNEGGSENVKNVNQLSVTTHAQSFSTAAAGGLVGANDYSSVKVENVRAQNLSVSGKNLRDLGGLLASGRKDGKFEVTKCSLASMKITLEINSNQKSSSACTGGIIGYHERPLTISEVVITSDSVINGQQFTGGFVGYSAVDVTIRDSSEENLNIKTDMNWIGGFIGYVNPNRTATFQNCKEENVNILGRYTGGLVGAMDGSILASNMEFYNVTGVTYNNSGFAALLVGNTENNTKNPYTNKVSGYNLLAKNCKFGYNNKAKIDELSTANIEEIATSGFWIGKVGEKGTIKLVAVAVQGDVFPQNDIGTKNGIATIIYADAFVDQTYQPINSTDKPSSSASPWLDVNPKSSVPFADGTVMTGNGVGMREDSTTAGAILKGLQAGTPASDVYWNLLEKKAEFVNFLNTANDAYVTTYRKEESATTNVSENVDFPVLVVNNTADVDTMIWNYIAAMTNVSSVTDAKQQINSITATTWQWNTTKSSFEAKSKENASLSISKDRKISIVPNAYDNQNSQFTLLDVTYANPTNDKAEPFHLYIPVLVKKVLYISFKTRFLAGTDYCAADYPMDDKATDHYATAGFDEPLTAYIEYSYEKDTNWQSMLDNGENLLWYYDKILDLASGSTAEAGKTLLPSGTRLTLVDRQTMQYYTYKTTGTEDLHKFDFAQMTTADGQTAFRPVYICDLLDMTVSDPVTEEAEGTTYYVIENDPAKATVRVGTTYYRRAEENDKDASKYRITITEASKSEARSEGYYLSVQVPETAGYSVINNRLNYGAISRKEGTLPAKIKSDEKKSGSGYVVYNGVEQKFTVSTTRVHNGNIMGDTAMEDSDSIKINLESKLKLTEAGKDRFNKLGPSEVHHQFTINLKKYLQGKAEEYDVIGTEIVKYIYTFKNADGTWTHTETGTISDAAGKDILSLQYGSSDLKKKLEKATNDANAITVTAEITLTYAGADKFPVRNTADTNDNSGICVIGVSRIANTQTQLPITENKRTENDKNRYYSTNPSKAKLTYSAVDQTAMGDTTQQLGINPSDTVNPADIIYTKADYDYSNVDETILDKAKSISYKMELFQKNDSGSYDETKPLPIEDYLQNTVKENGSTEASPAGSSETSGTSTVYQWEESFKSDDGRHQIARFRYAPFTGEAFERKNYTYANYRVRLTVVLLDDKGNELDGTKATDYIIYTNARISQEIMQQQQ
ncbi:MAG: hypothetical protein ACLUT4_01130 [Lachnospiraceae bacterium]